MFSPYGHVSTIGWGSESTDGLRAEYGRLRRCLGGHRLAPEGENIFVWRHDRARSIAEACHLATERAVKLMAQVELFRCRMRQVNKALYDMDVSSGTRQPLPAIEGVPEHRRMVPYVRCVS
jgi:hypothetical protein